MAISIYGDNFTNKREQMALLGILRQIEETYAWPVQETRQRLRKKGGMVEG